MTSIEMMKAVWVPVIVLTIIGAIGGYLLPVWLIILLTIPVAINWIKEKMTPDEVFNPPPPGLGVIIYACRALLIGAWVGEVLRWVISK